MQFRRRHYKHVTALRWKSSSSSAWRCWENASPELMATPRRGWGARRHKQNQCSLMHELDQQWLRIYIYIYTHADITVDLLYIVVVAVLAAVVLAVVAVVVAVVVVIYSFLLRSRIS